MTENNSNLNLVDQCHDLIVDIFQRMSEELIIDIEKALEKNIDNASSNQVHMSAFENSNIFRKNRNNIKDYFVQKMSEGFTLFKTHELHTHVRENDFHNESWSLVDDSILEETICIRTHSSELNGEYKDKLWQLQERLSYIHHGAKVDESNNPLSPVQFFVSLRFGLKTLPVEIATKLSSYKVLCQLLNQQYPTIINKANAFFISQGILPELNYEKQGGGSPVKNAEPASSETANDAEEETHSGDSTENTEQEVAKEESSGSSQMPLVNAIRGLLKRARNIDGDNSTVPVAQTQPENHSASNHASQDGSGEARRAPPKDNFVFDESQIVEAVEAVQTSAATAHFFSEKNEDAVLTIPTNIAENSARVFNQLYQESPDGSINAKNMYTIDMVGMLFEYILGDENLPDSIKTLLSHLHTPFLKLAFLDATFFENKEHKSRMLLDSLAEAGSNWVSHDGTAQYDMYNEIKRVVQRAVKEFKNDVNLFAELLMEFNLLKKRVSHMHSLRERNSIEKKQGQEKHDQAKAVARQEIKQRIEGRRVPSSIISLLSPWFTYLTFIHLKEGEGSDKWDKALQVIDNLITYCSIKQVKQDTTALSEGFDRIIIAVKEGLTNVAYNQAKAQLIIEELEELKYSVLNKKSIKTTKTKADTKADANEASRIAIQNDTPTPEEERVMNYIKLIEPGTWIEYNKESRLKVSGFNSEARKYILVDQSSQEVVMLTRLEFARDILAEKATVIDGNAKSLFERALERIRLNLDKQVQASAAMGANA